MTYPGLQLQRSDDYLRITMDHGKVNAIDSILAQSLRDVIMATAEDDDIRGVLLAGRPGCFSAGLDFKHMASSGLEEALKFWELYLGCLQAWIAYPRPAIAAITGYAPAGATILALCCDHRVMGFGEKHRIGLHEFTIGLMVPQLMMDIYGYHLGDARAWKYVQEAKLMNSEEGAAVGLIDQSVNIDDVLAIAESALKKQLQLPSHSYRITKLYATRQLRERADRSMEEMLADIATFVKDPMTQMMMQMLASS